MCSDQKQCQEQQPYLPPHKDARHRPRPRHLPQDGLHLPSIRIPIQVHDVHVVAIRDVVQDLENADAVRARHLDEDLGGKGKGGKEAVLHTSHDDVDEWNTYRGDNILSR